MSENYLMLSERKKADVSNYMPSEKDIRRLACFFQSFSDSTRLKIISCLSISEMCVNDISKVLKINQTTISHQLKTLKDQGVVSYKRIGKIIIYYLAEDGVSSIMNWAISSI